MYLMNASDIMKPYDSNTRDCFQYKTCIVNGIAEIYQPRRTAISFRPCTKSDHMFRVERNGEKAGEMLGVALAEPRLSWLPSSLVMPRELLAATVLLPDLQGKHHSFFLYEIYLCKLCLLCEPSILYHIFAYYHSTFPDTVHSTNQLSFRPTTHSLHPPCPLPLPKKSSKSSRRPKN